MRSLLTLCALVVSGALVYAQAPAAPDTAKDASQSMPSGQRPGGLSGQMKGASDMNTPKTMVREDAIKLIEAQLARVKEMQAKLDEHKNSLETKLAEVTKAKEGSEVDVTGIMPMRRPMGMKMGEQGASGMGQMGEREQGGSQMGGQDRGNMPPPNAGQSKSHMRQGMTMDGQVPPPPSEE
jgi:hypothetical protein